MDTLIVYEISTGRIVGMIQGQPLEFCLEHNCPEGCNIIPVEAEQIDHTKQYVVDGKIVDRPTFELTQNKTSILANGADVLQLSGYPEGATLSIFGPIENVWVAESPSQEITVNIPGDYQVGANKFPYQARQVEFNAA